MRGPRATCAAPFAPTSRNPWRVTSICVEGRTRRPRRHRFGNSGRDPSLVLAARASPRLVRTPHPGCARSGPPSGEPPFRDFARAPGDTGYDPCACREDQPGIIARSHAPGLMPMRTPWFRLRRLPPTSKVSELSTAALHEVGQGGRLPTWAWSVPRHHAVTHQDAPRLVQRGPLLRASFCWRTARGLWPHCLGSSRRTRRSHAKRTRQADLKGIRLAGSARRPGGRWGARTSRTLGRILGRRGFLAEGVLSGWAEEWVWPGAAALPESGTHSGPLQEHSSWRRVRRQR